MFLHYASGWWPHLNIWLWLSVSWECWALCFSFGSLTWTYSCGGLRVPRVANRQTPLLKGFLSVCLCHIWLIFHWAKACHMVNPDSGDVILHLLMGREICGHLVIYYTIVKLHSPCLLFSFILPFSLYLLYWGMIYRQLRAHILNAQMSSDKYILLSHHHTIQDMQHFSHPESPFCHASQPLLTLQTSTDTIFITIN